MRLLRRAPRGAEVDDLRARIAATMAHSQAELGRVDLADALLRRALADRAAVSAEATGILLNQRGLLLLRQGHVVESVGAFDRAVTALGGAPTSQCAVLLNRSAAHLHRGHVRPAGDDLHRCAALAAAQRHPVLEAKARHNLGYLAHLRGDVPSALRELGAAHEALRDVAPGYCGIVLLDRARVLRDVGLLEDADAELTAAVETLAAHRLDHDLAEAHLARAEVALLAGRSGEAGHHARAARQRFLRRHNHSSALLAELVLAQADRSTGAAAVRAAGRVRDVAARLRAEGLDDDARLAGLVADRIELRGGSAPAPRAVRPGDRIVVRLQVRLLRAEVARTRGDDRAARRELRRGLDELHRHRSGLGSHDLQTATGVPGRQLIAVALRAALADGRPSVVHRWVERTRAVSLRLTAVRPPDDPDLAAALTGIRAVRAARRAAELSGRPADAALADRLTALERVVRQRSWHVDGRSTRDAVTGLGRVRSELGARGGALVTYLAVDGSLLALVATGRAAHLVPLGGLAAVEAALARVRADMDAAARGGLPGALRGVVRDSTAAGLAALDARLWRPLAGRTGAGPLVVVPTGVLAAVPWTSLPGLRGRPVAVAPSATWWCRAERAHRAAGEAAFVAGPGLGRAEHEVRAAAACRPGAAVLTGAAASTARVLALAERVDVLHLAAHGHHETRHPLFSCVDLVDGPLFGYDLPAARRLPAHVVLSACELGLAVVRDGDEPLGMTAAFLHAGTTSVVGSPVAVGDDVAAGAMVHYHRELGRGRSCAEALAAAVERAAADAPGQPVPFVAYGAAW